MDTKKPIKCAVFCNNSQGEPDIFFCQLKATEEEFENGEHYDAAEELAVKGGYEPHLACDENDPAGAVMQLAVWESVPEHEVSEILSCQEVAKIL
jgi:hypothetical protein